MSNSALARKVPISAISDSAGSADSTAEPGAAVYADDLGESTVEFVRPFADLKDLPDDLAEAFETFKLAILHHNASSGSSNSRSSIAIR